MKDIIELTKAITNREFYNEQFIESETSEGKNILFVNPELSGKQVYKTVLPYFDLLDDKNTRNTAITGIAKYSEDHHLLDIGELNLTAKEILWADYIVFPFTVQNLWKSSEEVESYYKQIRTTNPYTKIVFAVDFNFYELSKDHPYYSIFADKKNFINVLCNIWLSDIVMVSNIEFHSYLIDRLNKEAQTTFKNYKTKTNVVCLPFIFDVEILLKNIKDYTPEEPTKIVNRKILEKVGKTFNKLKKEDIEQKSKKIKSNGKSGTKLVLKKSGAGNSGSNNNIGNKNAKPIIESKPIAGKGTKPIIKPIVKGGSKTSKNRLALSKNK